jgi:N-acetylmuramoyl-L-alanine amidase
MKGFIFLTYLAVVSPIYALEIILDIDHVPSQFESVLSSSCEQEDIYNAQLSHYIIKHSNSTDRLSVEMKINKRKPLRYETDKDLNNLNKDLLIAIHHGSVQKQYIQKNIYGCPTSKHGRGFSIFISRNNKYYDKSLAYAKALGNGLLDQGLYPSLHHTEKIKGENKEAVDVRLGIYISNDLRILNDSKYPALLLEAGVIVNPIEDIEVRSNKFRSKISNAILDLQ